MTAIGQAIPRKEDAKLLTGQGRYVDNLAVPGTVYAYLVRSPYAHAQRVRAEPRSLLAAIPQLELVEPAEQEICCGSAGIYNLVQPEAARELGDRKAANVLTPDPDVYASANPGCLVQVSNALRRVGTPLPTLHPVELLDASIHGTSSQRLMRSARK